MLQALRDKLPAELLEAFDRYVTSIDRVIEQRQAETLQDINDMMDQTSTAEERRSWWSKSLGDPKTVDFLESLWDELRTCESEYNFAHLCKWSGFFQSLLWAKWHYPTFTTKNDEFGHTADRTNPCLRIMFTKFGLKTGDELFMSEAIFHRFQFDRGDKEPYLKMEDAELAKHADTANALWEAGAHKVVLLLGDHNVGKFVTEDLPSMKTVSVKISDTTLFEREACVWLVLSENGEDIEKVVIPSYHTQFFFFSADTARGKVLDSMWNLAGALGGLSDVNAT